MQGARTSALSSRQNQNPKASHNPYPKNRHNRFCAFCQWNTTARCDIVVLSIKKGKEKMENAELKLALIRDIMKMSDKQLQYILDNLKGEDNHAVTT